MTLCPHCQSSDFYREKSFPKMLGLAIFVAAAIAVPWSYGISLIVAAIIDALIYKLVPDQMVCYRCRAVFSKIPVPESVKDYDAHKAELYEYGK